MKLQRVVGCLIAWAALCCAGAFAQSAPAAPSGIQNLYAGGVSWNNGAKPSIAGNVLYAHNLNTGAQLATYAFTDVDLLPETLRPFQVTTNVGAGIAQQIAKLGSVPIYVPTAAGVSLNGTNTGWQWNGGAMAVVPLKGNYYLLPHLRFLRSSVSANSGFQIILGLDVGWGK